MRKKILWLLDNLPELISGICITAAVLINAVNALMRYLLGFTIPGVDNIVALAFCWLIFLGAAAAYKHGKHFGVDLIVTLLPKRVQEYIHVVTMIIQILMVGALAYLGWQLTINVGDRVLTALGISYIYMDIGYMVGMALILLYTIIDFVKLLKTMRNHKAE